MENKLFPVVTNVSNMNGRPPSLFPSAGISKTDKSTVSSEKTPDWLENKSFTSDTAQKVVEFQKELKKLQRADVESSEEEVDKSAITSVSQPLPEIRRQVQRNEDRRKLIVSSDSETDHKERKHKKKKSRRRHSSDSEQYEDRRHHKKHKRSRSSSSDSSHYGNKGKKKKSSHHKHKKQKKKKGQEDGTARMPTTDMPGLYIDKKNIYIDDLPDIAPKHPFRLDRDPDKYSWTYGSLYAGNIAKYRENCQQCLGSQGKHSVHLNDRKNYKNLSNRYFEKENRKLIKQVPLEVLTADIVDASQATCNDYVPVCKPENESAKHGSVGTDVRLNILDESTNLYVHGVGAHIKDNVDACEDIELSQTRQKIGEFNRKLRETPADVNLWLEFVKFQDSILIENMASVSVDKDVERIEKKVNQRGLLDKKISILDRALQANPGNIDLMLARVELNSQVLDSAKVNKELEQLLFVHPANTKLWKYFLLFNQSRLAVFTVNKLSKLYHKCIKTLLGFHTGALQTHHVPDNLERQILEIFLLYCHFLKQAGYKERAIASYQALLEFNLFSPPSPDSVTVETKMATFEEFWDSNTPKLGSQGASGWKNQSDSVGTVAGKTQSETANLEEVEEGIIEKHLPLHATWLKIELLRDRHHWLPWQPDIEQGQTEEDCEDPERLVVFDDVKPVIFDVSKKFHFDLVIAFIEFLGYRSERLAPSIFEKVVDSVQVYLTILYKGATVESKGCDISGPEHESMSSDSPIVKDFVICLLEQLLPCFDDSRKYSELTLRLLEINLGNFDKLSCLSKTDKKEMRKTVKSVLKVERNRSDLSLWCLYIELEQKLGKAGEAQSIAETALCMYSGQSIDGDTREVTGLISLYALYCEILLNIDVSQPLLLLSKKAAPSAQCKHMVMAVLGCLVDGKKCNPKEIEPDKFSGAMLLRTASALSRQLNTILDQNQENVTMETSDKILALSWCLSLFSYCKSGLDTCLHLYCDILHKIQPCSGSSITSECLDIVEKRLQERKLRLIVYHMSVSPSPLSILRQQLDEALTKHPDHPVFLQLFVDMEKQARVNGRINRHFDKWCRTVDSPWPAVVAVGHQQDVLQDLRSADGPITSCGLVHRARSWLEHSLCLPRMQNSPLLWRLYLQLESLANADGRLKGVFYRAIQQCPWAKDLYLDGVQLLGQDQLQEIVDLMTEKEVRIQIPVEELDILMKP